VSDAQVRELGRALEQGAKGAVRQGQVQPAVGWIRQCEEHEDQGRLHCERRSGRRHVLGNLLIMPSFW